MTPKSTLRLHSDSRDVLGRTPLALVRRAGPQRRIILWRVREGDKFAPASFQTSDPSKFGLFGKSQSVCMAAGFKEHAMGVAEPVIRIDGAQVKISVKLVPDQALGVQVAFANGDSQALFPSDGTAFGSCSASERTYRSCRPAGTPFQALRLFRCQSSARFQSYLTSFTRIYCRHRAS